MPQWAISIAFFFAISLASRFAWAQTEFSADVIDLQRQAAEPTSKVYFAKDKLRIEQNSGAGSGGALIINLATQISTVLISQQHKYVEMPTCGHVDP